MYCMVIYASRSVSFVLTRLSYLADDQESSVRLQSPSNTHTLSKDGSITRYKLVHSANVAVYTVTVNTILDVNRICMLATTFPQCPKSYTPNMSPSTVFKS